MPRGDGTGPMGMGPMSGRGAGTCAGNTMPGYANRPQGLGGRGGQGAGRGAGLGRGQGMGGGRGWRNMFRLTGLPGWMRFWGGGAIPAAEPTPEMEQRFLKGQAETLQAQLDDIRRRLGEIETDTAAK